MLFQIKFSDYASALNIPDYLIILHGWQAFNDAWRSKCVRVLTKYGTFVYVRDTQSSEYGSVCLNNA